MLILLMVEDMLEELGCTSVLAAATNETALALLAEQTFDAVMLDMNLDGTSSHPVAQALAASGIPFVYATGSSVAEIEDGFRDRPLLRKPFAYEHLARTLGGLIHH
ncbi:MAG: response regulator [Rhizobium sp.]|nr:response regulator [Rhizobium sp.]